LVETHSGKLRLPAILFCLKSCLRPQAEIHDLPADHQQHFAPLVFARDSIQTLINVTLISCCKYSSLAALITFLCQAALMDVPKSLISEAVNPVRLSCMFFVGKSFCNNIFP